MKKSGCHTSKAVRSNTVRFRSAAAQGVCLVLWAFQPVTDPQPPVNTARGAIIMKTAILNALAAVRGLALENVVNGEETSLSLAPGLEGISI